MVAFLDNLSLSDSLHAFHLNSIIVSFDVLGCLKGYMVSWLLRKDIFLVAFLSNFIIAPEL